MRSHSSDGAVDCQRWRKKMRGVIFCIFTFLCFSAKVEAKTLFFAGDSTLDDGGYSLGGNIRPPRYSWGTQLQKSMKEGCRVANYARSGASTKSFAGSGRWKALIDAVKPGDFVLVQFGHNDQKCSNEKDKANRWAHPNELYREIVRGWVKEIRAKGATPILASSICRAIFDSSGTKLVDTKPSPNSFPLKAYRDAMSELSCELKCDFVDMNRLTHELMEKIGREESIKMFVGSTGLVYGKNGRVLNDITHPMQTGAAAFADLFVKNVKSRGLAVAALFKDAEFKISDFGAKSDGSKCTKAFAAAFAECEKLGGGRVVVPQGKWITGAIHLRSNCELHLCEGAEVVFSQDPNDYLPAVHTSWEGIECWNYSPLVYAYCCTNVAITGRGTLRGYEGEWKDSRWYNWATDESGVRNARLKLYTWSATDYPVDKREIYKVNHSRTRPHLVQFNRCKGVTLRNFNLRSSPFWTLHLYMCEDVEARGLNVRSKGLNTDGIDIEMSSYVIVEDCSFDQGGDGIAIKSARKCDGWKLSKPSYNVFIRDCEIVEADALFALGSEVSGGVKNVRLVNCRGGCVSRGISIETNRRRGGIIENISFDGVAVEKVSDALVALSTQSLNEWADFPDYENKATVIKNIDIRNVSAKSARARVDIVGEANMPVEDLRLENVTVIKADSSDRIVNANLSAANKIK